MAKVGVNNVYDDNAPVAVSDLGTFVSDNVLFPEGATIDGVLSYPELRLDSVQIAANMAKEIVRTKISTVRGEFKEYVSTGDYDIIITALVTPPLYALNSIIQVGQQYPNEILNDFHEIFKYNDVVQVRSKYLNNILDVNKVVISRASISKDTPDTFKLTINCISDFDFDFGDLG